MKTYKLSNGWTGTNECINLFTGEEVIAKKYNTSTLIVEYRLNSLKYEISQYISGVPLDKIEILSNTEQKNRKIKVVNIRDAIALRNSKEIDISRRKAKNILGNNNYDENDRRLESQHDRWLYGGI